MLGPTVAALSRSGTSIWDAPPVISRKVLLQSPHTPGYPLPGADQCWHTETLDGPWLDTGPYWLRQRNYLVTALLAAPVDDDALDVILATQVANGADTDEQRMLWQLLRGECMWGAVSLQLLGPEAPARVFSIAAQVLLRAPWAAILKSGWPLFRLLALMLRAAPGAQRRGSETSMNRRLWHVLREVGAMKARAKRRGEVGDDSGLPIQPGSALGPVERAALAALPWLQRVARGSGMGAANSWELWSVLAQLQEVLHLRSACPLGSFAVPMRSAAMEYRLCVRQPEAAGTLLGASLVDKRILNHGAWTGCAEAVQLLPRHRRCLAVDVGANIGTCTMLFSRLGMPVIAVEPEPSNLALLRATLRLPQPEGSTFANISIVPQAADEAAGFVYVHRDPTNAGNSSVGARFGSGHSRDPDEADEFTTEVRAVPLDGIVREHAVRLGGTPADICLLKIDVEAAELRVLRGAPLLLRSPGLRVVNFEFVPQGRDGGGLGVKGARETLELLAAHRFRIRAHGPVLEEREYSPQEFDGLIARLAAVGKLATTLTAFRPP